MASSSPAPVPGRIPAVAWILVLTVLVGVAAALVSRPVQPVAPSTPSIGALTWSQLTEIGTIGILVVVGVFLALSLRDVRGRSSPLPPRLIATILVVLLLGVVFVEVAGFVHLSPIPAAGNSTNSSRPSGGYPTNSSNVTVPLLKLPWITVPAWVGFAAIAVIALAVVVLLVPILVARAAVRRRAQSEVGHPAAAARQALEATLTRLATGDSVDAREAILALYARLLDLVGPRLGNIEPRTPREIERDAIGMLGIQARAAEELTETFEEARYSTHAMTISAVDRARRALSDAIEDLSHAPGLRA